jgi:hypothetical protein
VLDPSQSHPRAPGVARAFAPRSVPTPTSGRSCTCARRRRARSWSGCSPT